MLESAEERANIVRQQDEDYAVAEAVDRARNERQAREQAATSPPPAPASTLSPAIGGEPDSSPPSRAPMPQPAEEINLDAVRRARIARFLDGGEG